MMLQKDLWHRTLLPYVCFDETYEMLRQQVGEVEIAKTKLADWLRKLLTSFDNIRIASTDEGLMHDIFALLKDVGVANNITENNVFRNSKMTTIYTSIFLRKPDAIQTQVRLLSLDHQFPYELWKIIFEATDWKTWVNLHLVSKACRSVAQNIRHGIKFIEYIRATRSAETLPNIVIQKDLNWFRSPHDLRLLKEAQPDIEELLSDPIFETKPVYVPIIDVKDLSAMLKSLRPIVEVRSGNGISFSRGLEEHYLNYLETIDLFVMLQTNTTHSGCMGVPDSRWHTACFLYAGKFASINVPVLELCVKGSMGNVQSVQLQSKDMTAYSTGVLFKI